MKRILALGSLVIAVSLASVACGGTVETPQTTAGAATKAPVGTNTHGAVKVIGEALGEVSLRPDQRAEIEKLAADAEARHQPMQDGRKELMTAFADQIEKGSIDRSALQPKIDKVGNDIAKARLDDRAALVKLHDLLDNKQRNEFADALEKHVKGKRGELHMRGEHHKGGPAMGFGHLHALAEELKLTDEQKSKIHDVIKDGFKEGMKAMREHHKGGGHFKGRHGGEHHGNPIEAFREDKLELPEGDPKAMMTGGADRVIKAAEQILPILTPEQRKIVADKIRTMATEGNAGLLVH